MLLLSARMATRRVVGVRCLVSAQQFTPPPSPPAPPPQSSSSSSPPPPPVASRWSRFTRLLRLDDAPKSAVALGFGGLVPFVATGLAVTVTAGAPLLVNLQTTYAACILSFLGAVHWGVQLRPWASASASSPVLTVTSAKPAGGHKMIPGANALGRLSEQYNSAAFHESDLFHYAYGVTPSLVAWTALQLPLVPRLALLIGGFGAAMVVDLMQTRKFPPWYRNLRVFLTTGVVLSLGAPLMFFLWIEKRMDAYEVSGTSTDGGEALVAEE